MKPIISGGVMRDENGRWISGFAAHLGLLLFGEGGDMESLVGAKDDLG